MKDVYQCVPTFYDEHYVIRELYESDDKDLLRVYSDVHAVPYFNSDNCGGDDFYYTSLTRMQEAIHYWKSEYDQHGFVRWSIEDQHSNEVIGTIELFHRDAKDAFTNCGLLRLDLRSDYEETIEIVHILKLIIEDVYTMFDCDKIATKAVSLAVKRRAALLQVGFQLSNEKVIGHQDVYDSYFVRNKQD